MNSDRAPFPGGWLSPCHEGLWGDCKATYCFVPFSSLPRLDGRLFRGAYQWLTEPEPHWRGSMNDKRGKSTENLDALIGSAKRAGLRLPRDFVDFVGARHLQDRVPSVTGCYFDLSVRVRACPGTYGGHLARFMNDQQALVLWYLYLDDRGDNCVVFADVEWLEAATGEVLDDVVTPTHIHFCAPTFEEFIYRFWIENRLWGHLVRNTPLPRELQQYLDNRSV